MGKMKIGIRELMEQSNVQFGTSGARGLVRNLTDELCYALTHAFLQYLEEVGELSGIGIVGLGGDLRESTDRILRAASRAIADRAYSPVHCGRLPTPALTFFGMEKTAPTIMVTGSHIPEDRNGLKFTRRTGEILKYDEEGIRDQHVTIPDNLFTADGRFLVAPELPPVSREAEQLYLYRTLDFFPAGCLKGKKVGVYQHSAVSRDLMVRILSGLGAETLALDRSMRFVQVDTEALRPEDIGKAREWAAQHHFDAIVSTDGDSDRPLVADENGKWLRGDIAGLLTAAYLKADAVIIPVSCNTAAERCGLFKKVQRTRIGSPYVIEGIEDLRYDGANMVVGYEANGGFLLGTAFNAFDKILGPLPTRDATIVHLAVLLRSIEQGKTVGELVAALPRRFTWSDRLRDFPQERGRIKLAAFSTGDEAADRQTTEVVFGQLGRLHSLDRTDGLRITFEGGEILHLRPSGNAPEFRCYTEADTEERAQAINHTCLEIVNSWR